jgi:Multiubiquitin
MPNDSHKGARFSITINGTLFVAHDALVKGRDLLELAGLNPADEHLLFYRQADGLVEDINLAEEVDLSAPGREFFFAYRGDSMFFLVVDGRRFPWGRNAITGAELRILAEIPDDKDVYFDPKHGKDDLVEEDEKISLRGKDVEHFFTEDRPAGPVLVIVELNGESREILSGDYTTEALKQALGVPENWDLDRVDKQGSFHPLKPGALIKVRKGLKFVSHVRQGGSS